MLKGGEKMQLILVAKKMKNYFAKGIKKKKRTWPRDTDPIPSTKDTKEGGLEILGWVGYTVSWGQNKQKFPLK